MYALLLALALSADPDASAVNPAVLDLFDRDGDGSITDAEFTAGRKALASLNNSNKKPEKELVQTLDTDDDGKLSDEEILDAATEIRRKCDFVSKQVVLEFNIFDLDKNGIVPKTEAVAAMQKFPGSGYKWNRMRVLDADGDGAVSLSEVIAGADQVLPDFRSNHHPSGTNLTLWRQAVQTVLKLGGPDQRVNKLEAGKNKKLRDSFDEIDADKDERIKLIELYNWMLAQ